MKEVKKEIQRIEYKTVFVSTDGTEFTDKLECQKYEKSAKGVLMAKYAPKIVGKTNEESLFGFGCSNIDIVYVDNKKTADLLLQIYVVVNFYHDEEEFSKVSEQLNNSIGDFLVVGRGYDGDGFWFYGSRKEIIENFSKKFLDYVRP